MRAAPAPAGQRPALRWHCHLVIDDSPALPPALQLAVYRLAQELAQNVLKHAHATTATLEVEVLPAWVVLRVEDNGRGSDPTQPWGCARCVAGLPCSGAACK